MSSSTIAGAKQPTNMAESVLDASAVLALLANERGTEQVRAALGSAMMSAVNLAEVLTKLGDRGVTEAEQRLIRMSLDIEVRSFDEKAAWHASSLRGRTRSHGLSIGDRACLALGIEEGLPVLTTDRAWSKLDVGVEVRALR
jgi:PIN domain nuclease of toxin-antitoxin system